MMCFKGSRKGFTLVELIVVISILTILTSVLMPALMGVRSQARSVVCKTRQRAWNNIASIIASENDGRFRLDYQDDSSWIESLSAYTDVNSEMALCPEATRLTQNSQGLGSKGEAWGYSYINQEGDPKIIQGSFGLNYWIVDVSGRDSVIAGDLHNYWKNSSSLKSDTPVLGDCAWLAALPSDNRMVSQGRALASEDELREESRESESLDMGYFCIPRHSNDTAINMAFADGAVATVKLQDLWNIKWHRQFDREPNVYIPWLGGVEEPRLRGGR